MSKSTQKSKILFHLSGSIACFKACAVISELVKLGHDVQPVATPNALQFVGAATLEGLTGRTVYSHLWTPGQAMDHINWARWADLSVVCPASANTLAHLAHGITSDPIGTLFLAWEMKKKTWWIVPAMNPEMWAHPVTQRNITLLQDMGVRVLSPVDGRTACGEEGLGRMQESHEILRTILSDQSPLHESTHRPEVQQ